MASGLRGGVPGAYCVFPIRHLVLAPFGSQVVSLIGMVLHEPT